MYNIINYKTYIFVWLGLIILTIITVAIANANLGKLSILIPLSIAAIKSAFVVAYFMHLAFEQRLFKLIFFVAIITVTIIIGFTFFDISYR